MPRLRGADTLVAIGDEQHLCCRTAGCTPRLLLGHTKIESTVRYFGIEVDDALAIAEQVDF
jgi:hypothetical protein